MNKDDSKEIIKLIKSKRKFVTFLHGNPDMDSILSCILIKEILEKMGKTVDIFSKDTPSAKFDFLRLKDKIIIADPNSVKLDDYEVFLALDIAEIRLLGFETEPEFKGVTIHIDHHELEGFGDLNFKKTDSGSTCILIYEIAKKLGVALKPDTLNNFLLGLVTDSGVFHFAIYNSPYIFTKSAELIEAGADYDRALFYADQYKNYMELKFMEEAIRLSKMDTKHRFVYTAIPYSIFEKYEEYGSRSRDISDDLLRKVRGTDFCIVMIEKKEGGLKLSIRTRTPGFYVLELCKRLGGGGHLTGGGGSVDNKNFNAAVKIVLNEARKFALENRAKSN